MRQDLLIKITIPRTETSYNQLRQVQNLSLDNITVYVWDEKLISVLSLSYYHHYHHHRLRLKVSQWLTGLSWPVDIYLSGHQVHCFCKTQMFTAVFTKASHWIHSWNNRIHFTSSQPISRTSVISDWSFSILRSYPVSPIWYRPLWFTRQNSVSIYCFLTLLTCPVHQILRFSTILTISSELYKMWSC